MEKTNELNKFLSYIHMGTSIYRIYKDSAEKLHADSLIDLIVDPGSSFGLSLAVYLVVILFIIGGIANGIVLLISAIGLVISAVKLNKGCSKKTLAFFIVFTALPIVTEAVFYAVCMILNSVVNK